MWPQQRLGPETAPAGSRLSQPEGTGARTEPGAESGHWPCLGLMKKRGLVPWWGDGDGTLGLRETPLSLHLAPQLNLITSH